MNGVRLGALRVPSAIDLSDGSTAIRIARAAELEGFESLWVVEHIVVPEQYESRYPFHPSGRMGLGVDDVLPDPLIWLAFVAAATTTLRLGTGVLILPLRNPVILAKQLATLDRLSSGRLMVGVGLGWLAEEFEALGIPFAARGRRMDDHIAAMTALWREGAADFAGEHTRFAGIHSRPKPVHGAVPLHLGGASTPMVRRAVAVGDGIHLNRMPAADVRAVRALIIAEAALTGRDPAEIELTSTAPESIREAEALVAAGVSRLIVSAWEGGPDDFRARIASYRDDLAEHLAIDTGLRA